MRKVGPRLPFVHGLVMAEDTSAVGPKLLVLMFSFQLITFEDHLAHLACYVEIKKILFTICTDLQVYLSKRE